MSTDPLTVAMLMHAARTDAIWRPKDLGQKLQDLRDAAKVLSSAAARTSSVCPTMELRQVLVETLRVAVGLDLDLEQILTAIPITVPPAPARGPVPAKEPDPAPWPAPWPDRPWWSRKSGIPTRVDGVTITVEKGIRSGHDRLLGRQIDFGLENGMQLPECLAFLDEHWPLVTTR